MLHGAAATATRLRPLPSRSFIEVASTRLRPFQHLVHPSWNASDVSTPDAADAEVHRVRPKSRSGGILGSHLGKVSSSNSHRRDKYARALSDLHSAIDTGDPDRAYKAYESLLKACRSGLDTWKGDYSSLPMAHIDAPWRATSLTPQELHRLILLVCSSRPRLKTGLLRLMELLSHARIARQAASDRASHALSPSHAWQDAEVQAWNQLLRDPAIVTQLVSFIGRSTRSAGAIEVDEALAALAAAESEDSGEYPIHSRRLPQSERSRAGPRSFMATASVYETLLDIVARSVPFRDSPLRSQRHGDSGDGEKQLKFHYSQAHIGPGAEALGLSAQVQGDKVSSGSARHTKATAVHIFHSLWDRMCKQGIRPRGRAYTALLRLRLRCGDWGGVKELLRGLESSREYTLDIAHVNSVLWTALRTPWPSRLLDLTDEQRWECLWEAYQALRWNLVQRERVVAAPPVPLSTMTWSWDRLWGRRDEEQQSLATEKVPAGHALPTHTMTTPAVERLLGLKYLPVSMVPDGVTYAQFIRAASWRGDLNGALDVMQDMLDTIVDPVREMRRMQSTSEGLAEERSSKFTMNISIYDSLFRAFAKHGVPSQVIDYDERDPSATTWGPVGTLDGEQEQLSGQEVHAATHTTPWTIQKLTALIDGFLALQPKAQLPAAVAQQSHAQRQQHTFDDDEMLGPPRPHRRVQKRQSRVASGSAMSERRCSPESGKHLHLAAQVIEASRAPSPRQLFYLLTALRRTSNDHPGWVLHQWSRICDKFALEPSRAVSSRVGSVTTDEEDWTGEWPTQAEENVEEIEAMGREADEEGEDWEWEHQAEPAEDGSGLLDTRANTEGWTAFRLDARIRRTLEYLRSRADDEMGEESSAVGEGQSMLQRKYGEGENNSSSNS